MACSVVKLAKLISQSDDLRGSNNGVLWSLWGDNIKKNVIYINVTQLV